MPAYFLISIPRKEQSERKTKIGSLYLHPNFVYMTRNMQCGKIIDIGSRASDILPEAKIGDTLLVHHFVESDEKQQCVHSDDLYNYYVVTATSHNGQNNQTYGVYDGEKIIPHPEYLFLQTKSKGPDPENPEDYLNTNLKKSKSGLFLFKEWTVDREATVEQIKQLKQEIEQLTKPGMRMTPEVAAAVNRKEGEMNRLSLLLNKKRMEVYTVAAINPSFAGDIYEQTQHAVGAGDMVYMLNIACETKIEFNDTEFIVAKSQHFCTPHSWVIDQFNRELAS